MSVDGTPKRGVVVDAVVDVDGELKLNEFVGCDGCVDCAGVVVGFAGVVGAVVGCWTAGF